jgi:hypothetical protein
MGKGRTTSRVTATQIARQPDHPIDQRLDAAASAYPHNVGLRGEQHVGRWRLEPALAKDACDLAPMVLARRTTCTHVTRRLT